LNPSIKEGVVDARWSPRYSFRAYDADPIRPPMETMALIRQQVMGLSDELDDLELELAVKDIQAQAALCVGLGFGVVAQAMSVMLPTFHIASLPVPYFTSDHDVERLARQTWDTVIMGLPSLHAWQVANLLAGHPEMTFIKRRNILQGHYAQGDPTAHVPAFLELAFRFLRPGTKVVLIGDPVPYHAVLNALQANVEPLPDTTRRGLWVDYPEKQWAPHGLPRPTGKVLSFWRVK